MYRASTPTHNFTMNIDYAEYGEEVLITYKQKGRTIVEKTQDDITVNGNEISLTLTQEETNLFFPNEIVEIQLRIKTKDGKVLPSPIFRRSVNEVLNDKVM